MRDGSSVWFLFTGDSVMYRALATNAGNTVEVLLDEQSQGFFDLYNATDAVRSWSFGNLGVGPHVLQIKAYRGRATVDAFTTPGTAPFITPPARSGIVRYEEDDPALRYNGASFSSTAQSWAMGGVARLSAGYGAWSRTANDRIDLTFTGTWVNIGAWTRANAGKAEVFIDDVSQGVIDTYSASDNVASWIYTGLSAGEHTVTIKVLGQRNASTTDNWVHLDYIDVGDGTALASGTFEQSDGRVQRSTDWTNVSASVASGGT